jgi:predicted TPR repeat methyltransferase
MVKPVNDSIGTQYIFDPTINAASVIEQYRQQAAEYDEKMHLWQFLTPIQSTEILRAFFPMTAKILDAGCGTGLTGQAQYQAGFHNLHGFDISPEMLAIASAKNIYQSLKQGNLVEHLPYETATFDAVECLAVFTHIVDLSSVLREFHRIVKPGGYIIFSQRKDLFETRKISTFLDGLEREGSLEKVHQSDWLPYVNNHEDYLRNNITVAYFVYQVL